MGMDSSLGCGFWPVLFVYHVLLCEILIRYQHSSFTRHDQIVSSWNMWIPQQETPGDSSRTVALFPYSDIEGGYILFEASSPVKKELLGWGFF